MLPQNPNSMGSSKSLVKLGNSTALHFHQQTFTQTVPGIIHVTPLNLHLKVVIKVNQGMQQWISSECRLALCGMQIGCKWCMRDLACYIGHPAP